MQSDLCSSLQKGGRRKRQCTGVGGNRVVNLDLTKVHSSQFHRSTVLWICQSFPYLPDTDMVNSNYSSPDHVDLKPFNHSLHLRRGAPGQTFLFVRYSHHLTIIRITPDSTKFLRPLNVNDAC